MRIPGGIDPLDNTGVHPESYAVAAAYLAYTSSGDAKDTAKGGITSLKALSGSTKKAPGISKGAIEEIAAKLSVGVPTLTDIIKELEKPGRDPREDLPPTLLRSDVLDMKDLTEGMILQGTVRNVIDFGAFVDIGVHQDGLVHISQICDRFIKHPLEAVQVGEVVKVKVLSVDIAKKRIALSMRAVNKAI